ncbi:MAG: RNA polymerase sigma factor [Pirellulales bacterium]
MSLVTTDAQAMLVKDNRATVSMESPPAALPVEPRSESREEALLIASFVAGDTAAFDRIVALHQVRVARLAYRLLGWPDEVDDVVQEVFLAAFKGLRKFRGQSKLSTWLTTIAINKCRSHGRKRLLRLNFLTRLLAAGENKPAALPERPLMDREKLGRVRQAVQTLPARYREVVVLRYLEEMSIGEISEVLALSRNAVEVRLTRGRNRLKGLLAGLVEE